MTALSHKLQIFRRGYQMLLVCGLAASVFVAGCGSSGNPGSSGNNGGSGSGGTASVRGTASMGAPIVGATVTLKDSAGKSSTATTASDGTYTLDSSGMTPPYFVRVVTSSGATLYSVSADALASTTINTHVLTDLIVRSWFTAQGVNPNTAFNNPVVTPPPSPLAVQTIASTVINVLQLWLNNFSLTVTASTPSGNQINLISSPLTANDTGLDAVLHLTTETVDPNSGAITQIQISNSTTTQVSAPTYGSGNLTVNTTTTSGNATSSETVTGVVPNTAQQTAENAINAEFTSFENTVNSKGAALAASDLLPFFANDYLNGGNNGALEAANFASSIGGATINIQVTDFKSIDTVNGKADVVSTVNLTSPTQGTQSMTNEFFFENSGGTWLLGGDKRLVKLMTQQLTWNSEGTVAPTQPVNQAVINAGFDAPVGTMNVGSAPVSPCQTGTTAQSISGGGSIWPAAPCQPTNSNTGMIFYGGTNSGGQGQQTQDEFAVVSGPLPSLLSAGTIFTYNLTPVSGSPVTYSDPINAGTNESIAITSVVSGSSTMTPPSGALSNYALGQPATLNWTLPQTFAIASVKYSVSVFDGIPGGTGPGGAPLNSCGGNGTFASITATSATVAIPATDTCNGNPIKSIILDVVATGVNGEVARASVFIQ